jgi:hypothetical protein
MLVFCARELALWLSRRAERAQRILTTSQGASEGISGRKPLGWLSAAHEPGHLAGPIVRYFVTRSSGSTFGAMPAQSRWAGTV